MSVWESYVKSLQADGYTMDNNALAYRQAAEFINIASGRGSLKQGGKLEMAMQLGGQVLFAPRNLASKFQLLDPVRYATLAPGARKLVLRDAMTSFGAMLGTAILLKASGVSVSLDPRDDNFMEARWGNHRYDLTGGLKTEVRFLAKMARGVHNQATGEGNLPGQEPLSVAKQYARGKLAPGPGLVYDALAGEDFKGQKFSEKSKTDIALQFAPMTVEDMVEAYQDSGGAGMIKASPAFFGHRVSVYGDRAKAEWLDEPQAWRAEQKKAGEIRMHLEPKRRNAKEFGSKDETPAEFAARLGRVNQLLNKYGAQLVASDAYKRANQETRDAMRERLRRAIGREDVHTEALHPLAILEGVRESAYQKAEKQRGK
jgi:hypothetical protein